MSLFIEKYLQSLNAYDLRDDARHRHTEALAAAALADMTGGSNDVFGSLLARVKYADGLPYRTFEAGNGNLAALLRAWERAVTQKGLARQWLRIRHEWDVKAAHGMYAKIARVSLAHWLGGECERCHGTKLDAGRGCAPCAGTGREPIRGGALEVERVKDMVSELEGLYQAHCARAAKRLRQVA